MDNQIFGRKKIITSRVLTGNPQEDSLIIPKILNDSLKTHKENAARIQTLFEIYFNSEKSWEKTKKQRDDINNKITIDDAWAISRTINGYCFGEPIKYVARDSDKQEAVELLSQFFDYQHNHDSTSMATLSSSICGVGYKLALPSTQEELNDTGIPFIINSDFIYPQKAFCVYDSSIAHRKVLGVMISDKYDDDNKKIGETYTVWTATHQFIFDFINNEFILVPKDDKYVADAMLCNHIPLIEVERNPFRKGDWEICIDLFKLKNELTSSRADDVSQIIDYVLLMINCWFENEEDKENALNGRLFRVMQKDPQNKPDVKVLQNPLDQSGVQMLAEYIDLLIETTAGIPSRSERSGGGHDTGAAVIYRNGYRDLENNAGIIIPKMDKAETEFIAVCLGYTRNSKSGYAGKLSDLHAYDVRNKFVRSLSDDPISASTAYGAFRNAGMNDLDALIASRAVTDPAEVHKNNLENDEKESLESNKTKTAQDMN